nr:hypothetical protein [Tanacetum cinerariifolium]
DIPILEELLDNYSISLPANESYHFDIPSPYRPPAKPPDDKTSFSDEDFSKKIYSNPFSDEEIIPIKIDQHLFNAESDLIDSMPNHDSSIIISSKIDSLFGVFAGELTILTLIPPGIDETDFHPEKETRFAKRLLYDNSSPRPSKEIVSDNSNADIESFSPSLIPNKDSDSHMEEIDLPFTPDDPMPSGIEMMIMTLEGIFRSLKNYLTIIPFHSLPMSHTILIFLHLIVLLQNHQMIRQYSFVKSSGFVPGFRFCILELVFHPFSFLFVLFNYLVYF